MKKKILFIVAVICFLTFAACNPADNTQSQADVRSSAEMTKIQSEPITIKVGVPTAPPALPVLRMIDTQALGEHVEIEIDIWSEPETLIAMVQGGEHAMFAFPLTVISTLYNKGIGVRLMNVNTWGVTYFLTSDPEFKEWGDLKGKTVYVPLQSSPPDALTQYFLAEAGLKIGEDVKVIYAGTAEIATLLASGEATYATLIEPQVTRAMILNENVRVALSFEEEWQRINDTTTKIPNAGFGVTQTFLDENPELTAEFQKAYEEAVIWANENPEEMGALAEKHLSLPKQLIVTSLPSMGLTFQSATDSSEELMMFYELLYNFNPQMIGGKIAGDEMYYEQ